jgi:serine protease Do
MIGKELRNAGSNTWIHYAIPVTELADLISDIRSGKYNSSTRNSSEEAEAALRYRPLDFGIVLIPDVVERTPAYVDTVVANSAAAKAGMQPDDLVLFVNDELVQSSRALKASLGRLEAGDTLKLVVRRKNRLETFELAVPKKNGAAKKTEAPKKNNKALLDELK